MKQKELLDNIKKYLARFQTQVAIANANNEYDINIHAENVIIPILNEVYQLNLKNVNYSEGKNAEAIDLIDEEKKVAFQITSNKNLNKIKDTIQKLTTSKFKNRVDRLFVYILVEKNSRYSQEIINKVSSDNNILFSAKDNILDAADIYRKINKENNILMMHRIESILRLQFSDILIGKDYSFSNFEEFKEDYKKSCLSNFSRINFFGLSVSNNKPREIELYSLFVKPEFRSGEVSIEAENVLVSELRVVPDSQMSVENSAKYTERLKINMNLRTQLLNFDRRLLFSELFSRFKHIAVIGKPGAGKSSLVKYSICKILENDRTVFAYSQIYEYIPFRIELHKYNKFKRNNQVGLLDYLSVLLNEEYQIILSKENIESIVKSFLTVFFFDGLDEIFDIQDRVDVRNDIESFIKGNQHIRAIVTSRFESYEEVSMSKKIFGKLDIMDFSESQVKEYVNKWYSIEESSDIIRQREVKNCLHQLQSVDDELKHNPLLLSLILLLYRNELDIPTSKLSIYESCTNTIVETRDTKEKKLDFRLKVGNVISVFADLAYWQFGKENAGDSINYEKVAGYIKNALLNKGEFKDDYLATLATAQFLDFAKTRSIYFENKFTHKTFLEYFTAYYLFSFYYGNWKKAAELNDIISKYIGLSTWSVVLELLFCKIDSNQITYEVMDDLVDKQFEQNKVDTLIFLLQILKYLKNISPDKIKFIINKSIEYCFRNGETTKEGKIDYKESLFASLGSFNNLEQFKGILEISFNDLIKDTDINADSLYEFAYEFEISYGNNKLVSILDEKGVVANTPYIFILKHYTDLFENDKYLETLKKFIDEFNGDKAAEVYTSQFNPDLFFTASKFNWCLTYLALFANRNSSVAYKELIEQGLSHQNLLDAASAMSASPNSNLFSAMVLNKKDLDPVLKKFRNRLRATYSLTSK
jgi:hypothetical protein